MNYDEIKDSIAAYCLGALDPEEKENVEEQIASGDPEILQIYNEMMQVTSALPFETPTKKPPRRLKASILVAIEPEEVPATQQVISLQKENKRWFKLSMSFAFATVLSVTALVLYSAILKSEIKTLRNQLSVGQELMTNMRDQLAGQQRILNVVQSSELRIIDVAGTKVSPASMGKVYWDTEKNKAIFYAYNLPELPPDKDYQLWMLRSDQPEPVSAGVFTLDENGLGAITLDVIADPENLSAFAVSLEPKSGVPQPTGDIYLVGSVVGG